MKKKSSVPVLLSLALGFFLVGPTQAQAIEQPEITSPYAILVDANHGEVLFSQNATTRTYPASTTKIMTGLVVARAIDNGTISLDTMVTATEASTEGLSIYGSTQGIDPGETMSVEDLLHCLLLASANESGNILAIAVSGSLANFVEEMNQLASEIGCTDTQFVNTHGLHDPEHYTSASDLALIFTAAMENDLAREIMGTVSYTTQETNAEPPREFYNTNALLSEWYYRGYSYEPCIGGKTGTTPEAGRCLVSGAEQDGQFMVAVVLGAQAVIQEDGSTLLPQMAESRTLLSWGLEEFERRTISPGVEPVAQIPVTLSGDTDHVMVKADGEIIRTLPKDMDLSLVEQEIHLEVDTLEAPVAAGQNLGWVVLSYEGETYGTLDLVAVNDVERSSLLFQKQKLESVLENSGGTMLMVAAGGAAAVGGVALTKASVQKHRRRNGWRNNQRRNNKRH